MAVERYPEDFIEPRSPQEATRAFFPEGEPTTNNTPLNTAWLWWTALLADETQALQDLSYRPEDWDGYRGLAEDLSGHALAQFIEFAPDASDIAYAKFLPDPGYSGVVKKAFQLTQGRFLILVEEGDAWYVWGLSEVPHRPDSRRVRYGD